MKDHIVSENTIEQFREHLIESEKSDATVQKYIREIMELKKYLAGEPVTKGKLIFYRRILQEKKRATTVNGTYRKNWLTEYLCLIMFRTVWIMQKHILMLTTR